MFIEYKINTFVSLLVTHSYVKHNNISFTEQMYVCILKSMICGALQIIIPFMNKRNKQSKVCLWDLHLWVGWS